MKVLVTKITVKSEEQSQIKHFQALHLKHKSGEVKISLLHIQKEVNIRRVTHLKNNIDISTWSICIDEGDF